MNPGPFSLYANAPRSVQLHVRARWATCPFEAVGGHVPPEGRVLEVGCGYGVFSLHLALEEPRRSVVGVDIDSHKIVHGQRAAKAAQRRGATVDLQLSPPGEVPPGPWDAIVIVDVLYLLDAEEQAGLVRTCAAELRAGGLLLVKEMATRPAWKARWNRLQETAAVKVLRITAGEHLTFLPPDTVAAWMESEGLEVSRERLDRGYPHPHHLLTGRRPTLVELRPASTASPANPT